LHTKFAIGRLVGLGRLQGRTNKCWHLNFYHQANFCCYGKLVTRIFGELEHKIYHIKLASIRCISKMFKQAVFGVARWHLGLHLAWPSLMLW